MRTDGFGPHHDAGTASHAPYVTVLLATCAAFIFGRKDMPCGYRLGQVALQ